MEIKKDDKTQVATLPNGMRVVHKKADSNVAYIGLLVDAGSRDELPGEEGLAHFVEHTIFKGTAKKSSKVISSRMESIGGELNAYTSKENTMIYTNALAGYSGRSIELLSDLVANASFPEEEVEREKDVVIEEIHSYLDSPSETAFDEFENRLYEGSGPGHPILGTVESVTALTPGHCRRFVERNYSPDNMVAYCVSPDSPDKIFKEFDKYFSPFHRENLRAERIVPTVSAPFSEIKNNDGHQAHTILGTRLFSRQDSRRNALYLLNNYLGGPGMNSVFNQQLREKRGYVYTVESFPSLMSDSGSLQIYFGCSEKYVQKCAALIERELKKMAETPMKPRLFNSVKRQYIGQLLVAGDNRETSAMSLAKSLLYYGKVITLTDTAERIKMVTPEEVREIAGLILEQGLSQYTVL